MPDIGILVVHGIGEQRRVATLTSVASNFYRSLKALNVTNLSRALTLEDPTQPATFAFSYQGIPYTVRFYEAYWADLDQPYNFWRWLKVIWWGLTIWVRRYYEPPPPGMRVIDVGRPREALTRIGLFILSVVFLLMLLTLRVLNQLVVVVFRRSIPLGQTLYNFLGDVQLFVSQEIRYDMLETLDRKSRYAIRTRLWEALARAHLDPVEHLYILAHSLGSVIAFNVLMEPTTMIARYIDDATLRQRLRDRGLIDAKGNADRVGLLSKIRAFFTAGSPLDKFAAIWPRVIPVNRSDPRPNARLIRWVNVHDVLDVVGANLNHFLEIPGLTTPQNVRWRDQVIFATAHTSYWTRSDRNSRFIDRFTEFILDQTPVDERTFRAPENRPLWAWIPLFLGGVAIFLYVLGALGWMILAYFGGAGLKIWESLFWFRMFM